MNERIFNVRASQAQHTPEGHLLGRMFYGHFLDAVTVSSQRSGYPHNGGEHTLSLSMTLPDLKAFLDLVLETFKGHEGAVPFVESVKARFRQAYPSLATAI